MNKIITILLFNLSFLFVNGQDIKTHGTISEIICNSPKGYTLLDSTIGNLNRDPYPDLVIVYDKEGETEDDRPLLLYIGNEDGTLSLAARNDKTVYCAQCGGIEGDPFTGVAIKNGYFTVEHYGGSAWRWTRYITFRYSSQDGKWYLSRDSSESFNIGDPENVSTTIKTAKDFGRVSFEEYILKEL